MDRTVSIKGLFWNVGRQDRRQIVAEAAAERNLEIIVLAEAAVDTDDQLQALEERTGAKYSCPASTTPRLQIYSRLEHLDLSEIYATANGRLTIRRMLWNDREFLFIAVHLLSKLNWDDADQHAEVQVMADQIRREELQRGHRRTILVGDLNMNPFERGVVQSTGLHAMMSKADIVAGTRVVQTQEYPFFYNPMWGLFGDRTPGPPGSFYYRPAQHLSYDWHILDQLLIRPEALAWFDEDVEIATRIGDKNLLTEFGRPNRDVGSDHFPLIFALNSHANANP